MTSVSLFFGVMKDALHGRSSRLLIFLPIRIKRDAISEGNRNGSVQDNKLTDPL